MTRISLLFGVLFIVILTLSATGTQDQASSPTPEDLARGRSLFIGHCAVCHGIDGVGGRGPSLNQPKLRRADNNLAFFLLVKNGLEEMPGAWQMTDREVWQVVGYVRSLGRTEIVPLPGDAARGMKIYQSNACASCHILRGQGKSVGPELTLIGARRSPVYLREALLDPAASSPEGFLVVTAITRSGQSIRGTRASEDSFTIQIRDAASRMHSFRKSELTDLKKEFGVSTMPSYREPLTATDLDDLVAFLAGLRGGQ